MNMNISIVKDDQAIFDSLNEGLTQWSFDVTGPNDFHDLMDSFIREKRTLS